MSYDFVAETRDPVDEVSLRRAVADALGVPEEDQLRWTHRDEWVKVDLEISISPGESRHPAPGQGVDRVSIQAGQPVGWRSWERIFCVAQAIQDTATVRTLDLQREQYLDDLQNPSVAQRVPSAIDGDLSADGRFLFTQDQQVHIVDLCNGDRTETLHLPGLAQAQFLAAGPRFLCTIGDLKEGSFRVEIRQPGGGEPVATFDEGWPQTQLNPWFRRGPNGDLIDNFGYRYSAAGERTRVADLDGTTGCAVSPDGRIFEAGQRLIATFCPDGRNLVTSAPSEKRILLRDAQTGVVRAEFNRCGEVTCLEFVTTDRLASGSRSSSAIRLWDLSNGRSSALKAPGGQPTAWEWPVGASTTNPAPVRESGRRVLNVRLLAANRLAAKTSDYQITLWNLSRNSWDCIIGVRADGSWVVSAADGGWDASEDIDRLAWSWITDARCYANFWLRPPDNAAHRPGLLQDFLPDSKARLAGLEIGGGVPFARQVGGPPG